MSYEFLDHVATADIAFRVVADTLENLFVDAATAVLNATVENPQAVEPREQRTIEENDVCEEMLLHDFLEELVYYKDAEQLLLKIEKMTITHNRDGLALTATAVGERIDRDRHHVAADVKAVTFYRFEIKQTEHGYEATVVLDV